MAEKKDAISKRARNREIERKKRQHKLMSRYGFFALAILLFLGLCWMAGDAWSRRWILNVDGTRVSAREFRFLNYLYGDKDFAMQMLQNGVILEREAANLGISLTDAERQEARELAEMLRDHYRQIGISLNFLSLNRKAEILAWDWHLSEHLIDRLLPEANFSAEASERVASDFAFYLENHRLEFTHSEVRYILSADRGNVESALTRLGAGEDFNTLIREYSLNQADQHEDHVFQTLAFWDLAEDFELDMNTINAVLDLEAGQASEIIDIGGWFLIILVDERFETDPEVVENSFMQDGMRLEDTIRDMQIEAFTELVDEWMDGFDPTINQRAFDRV